jgi:hypothetical protein
MEDDLRTSDHRYSLDVAMLYYAGHGVQSRARITYCQLITLGSRTRILLKRRAINAAEYIQAMADAGSRLISW